MKRLSCSLLLLCLCLSFSNIGHTYTVNEIFQNFKMAYEKSKNFSAEFEETTLFKTKKSVTRGRFTFGKPNLLRKEYVAPKAPNKIVKTIVLDGAYAWSYTPMLNQVNKTKLQSAQRRELLPGIGASLKDVTENWDMKHVPDEAANAKGVYQIQLTPKPHLLNRNAKQTPEDGTIKEKPKDGDVKETIEIWVKEGEWLPVQFGHAIEYEDGSRRSVIVKLSKIERDKKLHPKVFKFVYPEDAEVIDLSEN